MTVTEQIPEETQATGEMIAEALETGGRAEITVRSLATGAHIKLSLAAKKKGADGRYISRASKAGRVGAAEADRIFITDPDLEWPEARVGAYDPKTGRFFADTRDMARSWAARALLEMAFEDGNLGAKADVMLATRCCFCAKRLTDPVSIARMIGPECFGSATGSKLAARTLTVTAPLRDADADGMEYYRENEDEILGAENAELDELEAERAAETRPLSLLEQLAAGRGLNELEETA